MTSWRSTRLHRLSEGLAGDSPRPRFDLQKRAARADVAAALRILDRVPDTAPDEDDELPP
jgi:hypothetical protein